MARRLPTLLILAALLMGCAASSTASPSATSFNPAPTDRAASPTSLPTAEPTAPISSTGGLLIANVPRAPAGLDDAQAAAEGINDFGLELLRRLAADDEFAPGNAVISPASIAVALGMARAGARGATATEMDAVLRQVANPDNAAWLNALDQELASRNESFVDDGGTERDVILRIANALFAQEDMAVERDYLETLAETYGAGVRLVDYRSAPEEARAVVNGWVAEATEQRIPKLLNAGDVDDLTRLILVNAVYLKAPWSIPFNEDATADGSFTTSAGETVRVPMMWSTHTMAYAHGDGWQAVDLAYLGNTLSMVLILPDDVEAFVRDMDGARLASIVAGLSGERVALTMPRFGIETRASLPDVLKAMGMPTAFTDGAADFSGITTEERILITEVIHQANIDVDEEGTEASAATAVIGGVTGGPPPVSVELRLDRPFLFALRDVETGVVLFLGQVGDPSTRS